MTPQFITSAGVLLVCLVCLICFVGTSRRFIDCLKEQRCSFLKALDKMQSNGPDTGAMPVAKPGPLQPNPPGPRTVRRPTKLN